jgi:hypothetical protein
VLGLLLFVIWILLYSTPLGWFGYTGLLRYDSYYYNYRIDDKNISKFSKSRILFDTTHNVVLFGTFNESKYGTFVIPGLNKQNIELKMYYNVDYYLLGVLLYNLLSPRDDINNNILTQILDDETYDKSRWAAQLAVVLEGVKNRNILDLLFILLDWNINQENIIDKIKSNEWVSTPISKQGAPFKYENNKWIKVW